jgi:aspartyl-tRNA synthetase
LFTVVAIIRTGFVGIHTPKLIGGASEGGSSVFNLDYFGKPGMCVHV